MASASVSNPIWIVEVGEEYPYGPSNNFPYPSHNFANINIVTVKLSGRDVYNVWEEQMLCLLTSHDMLGFIDGRLSPSDGNGKAKEEDMKAWIRSDSLVKGWILGSLSEKVAIVVVNRLASKHKIISTNTFYHKNSYFSAKDAWDELKLIYGPRVPQPAEDDTDDEGETIEISEAYESLCQLIRQGESEKAYAKLRELNLTPTRKITSDGNTSLHVAVSNKNQELLERLLQMIPENKVELLNVRNSDRSTPLHIAAIVGNTEAADVLVQKDPELLFAEDNKGHTPLAISISKRNIQTSQRLFDHIGNYKGPTCHTVFSGTSGGDELLLLAISSKKFDLSLKLVRLYKIIPHSEAVLMAIAQNFPCELCFLERIVQDIDYHAWEDKHRGFIWKFLINGISKIHMVSMTIIKKIVSPFLKKRLRTRRDAIDLLWAVLVNIEKNNIEKINKEKNNIEKINKEKNTHLDSPSLSKYYTNLVFLTTRLNVSEVVNRIIIRFPDAFWRINEDGHTFIQYAVINRSEKIYNLLNKHNMSDHKNIFKRIKDPYGNNLLHLAARLAPADKLNLISGAALQIQRELQWFKEVGEFVGPLTCIQKNYDDETPEMVFTREHANLVIEGEKWMRATAESYTITAALIITIVFAAAITVPGGSNQETGMPIHDNNIAFKMFAVSDAISLFTAVTSLVMFLSILTTRFSTEDFLFKLPTRLIIGLAALFISTTAMIIAFGATLFLVFGHDNSWVLIPIGVLTCLPVTTFVTSQFPLIVDLNSATFGHIFDKRKPDNLFYHRQTLVETGEGPDSLKDLRFY